MIVDANVLLYAADSTSPHHERAAEWLTEALNGRSRVGLPAQSLGAFLRIATHPRASRQPLSAEQAYAHVSRWLDAEVAWVPPTTTRTISLLGELLVRHGATGSLVPDAQLAALALEHGVAVVSADADFARFPEVRWIDPLR